MPVRSGYGPAVSDGVAAHAPDVVPPVDVLVPLLVLGLVGLDPQPMNAAPTAAVKTPSMSRRVTSLRSSLFIACASSLVRQAVAQGFSPARATSSPEGLRYEPDFTRPRFHKTRIAGFQCRTRTGQLQRGLGLFTRATNLPQTTRALRWCDPSTVNRQPMRIALAQINPTSGDIRHNTERILDALTAARRERADLVVVPEMALPGYCIGDLVEDAGFLDANERAMQAIAQAARGITAVVGFIDFDPAARNDNGTIRKYNAAAVVRDGNVLQRARKSLLPNYRYFDDKRFFTPGERRDPIDVAVGSTCARIGVSICEDMWDEFYEIKPLPELVAKGASVLLNLNASPFHPGKRHTRERLIRGHIAQFHRPIVYVNTVGAADTGKNIIPFDGESLVYDAAGRLVAVGRQFDEDLLVVDLEAAG